MKNDSFPALSAHSQRTALIDADTRVSYGRLQARIDRLAAGLLGQRADLREERVAVFAPAGLDYVTALHGIWRAGGIAVPLNVASAEPELAHRLADAEVTRLLAGREHRAAARRLGRALGIQLLAAEDLPEKECGKLPEIDAGRRAMIVFTSGTSGRPKGVVTTHGAIRAQITTLLDAWKWSKADAIPLFLPLHHVHGIINVLSCALWRGATVHAMPRLDIPALCAQVAAGAYTLFMAVPTIYVKLIRHIRQLPPDRQEAVRAGFRRMRVNIAGSSACPARLFHEWRALTGQAILERYGTTETGMALANPYDGERRAGSVGQALPGVAVQLFGDNGEPIGSDATPGEIRVRGPSVLKEYWNNAEETAKSFRDGWFCTGDVAVREDGYYRILGRASIDIIKSGGYKLSALEIEGVLQAHEAIREAAVVGVPDETWGESVAAAVTLEEGASLDLASLKQWCGGRISAYKIPKRLKVLNEFPRNEMGKVLKTALRELF